MNTDKLNAELERELKRHALAAEALFSYLHERAAFGFTPAQYRLYRDNYFYRTTTTVESVAKVAVAAACAGDDATLSVIAKNLYEEAGEGIPARGHRRLLEVSHNIHAEHVFGLPWFNLADAGQSPLLLEEARAYRRTQAALYENRDYVVSLAASFAQEEAACGMLDGFYRTLFLPYQGYYRRGEFGTIAHYFLLHLGGMEQEHGAKARASLLAHCHDDRTSRAALEGCATFLDTQATLWAALARAMRSEEHTGEIIRPV